jgi:glycosyltransferase involved in cell wall biosynthesis
MARERSLKVLLVVDHFGSGGAQRQIVELACGLKRRGHAVHIFAYFPRLGFFRPRLDEHQVLIHEYDKGSGFSLGVVRRIVGLIVEHDIDIVVSYLSSPNIYAELAKVIAPRVILIVSERTSHYDDKSRVSAFFRRAMHTLANHVVANSEAQCEWLRRKWWLRGKVSCIYNGLDPSLFTTDRVVPESRERLRLVAVGRVGPEKNALNLIRGLLLFHREAGYIPEVSWVGERDGGREGKVYCQWVDELLAVSPEIRRHWHWLDVEVDVRALLQRYDALIHPSLYEGLPNVVCEALAAGMPVLASNVCDHPRLVADGERGFLFDPVDPRTIVTAIKNLIALSPNDWRKFSLDARQYAIENLDVEKMITAYENLFVKLLASRRRKSSAS